VKPGDNLFEIETDKTSMEVPSTVAGKLSAINVQVGEVAKVGAVVAVIGGAGDAAAPAPVQVEVPAKVPPGQVKKEAEAFLDTAGGGSPNAAAPTTEAPTAPPEQAKEEEATTE
jgi:pyruvate/2-oxoglutarate dehydrogenase complex dihydrolipoamide acyltransferase (E2) component